MSVVGLPPLSASALLSAWVVRPVALTAVALTIAGYGWLVYRLRRRGVRWPARWWAAFLLGVALFGWVTGGMLQVYAGRCCGCG